MKKIRTIHLWKKHKLLKISEADIHEFFQHFNVIQCEQVIARDSMTSETFNLLKIEQE